MSDASVVGTAKAPFTLSLRLRLPQPVWHASALLAICSLLFFLRLGERGLTSSHEARAGQNARSIVREGRWSLPELLNGRVELQKPPLYYWLIAGIALLGGGEIDAWTVRLPAALSALGCVFLVYFVGWRMGRARAGFLAGAILATSLHFTWLARVGRIDMPLSLCVSLAIAGFYLAGRVPARRGCWLLLAYLGLAAGVLLKGPVALVLPTAVITAWSLLQRRNNGTSFQREVLLSCVWGVPLVVVLTVPWFLWADAESGGRLWHEFFWHHNVARALGTSDTLAVHPWWYYLVRLPLDLLPWSVLLPVAVWRFSKAPQDTEARLGLVWFVTILGVLSLVGFKRADYLLPAFPGMALFLGCVLDRWLGERRPEPIPAVRWLCALLSGYALCWALYLGFLEPRWHAQRDARPFAQAVRQHTSGPVIFFRAEAHDVVFHVDQPLDTILEWENLDVWATKPEVIYFVMPPECADNWRAHLIAGRLEEVGRWQHADRPLVLMRSCHDR